ncbi:related to AP endonuclease [Cephalotrichum gorgonifer]|uniref:Apurinic-apyrimidinic endonuclease 1 n=1 Tax=Cephalotrichum gorgonifer TaxID=2041049 RepID=A0AAE8MNV5_9PEZI|nr:related to AP endonuclease [Cephalotrichum gorgonifer]
MCPTSPRKRSSRQTAKSTTAGAKSKRKVEDTESESEPEVKPKKRKTATAGKKKEEDMGPLAARTAVSSLKKAMYIGAHVSSAGGVHNSLQNATNIGANAFALFLKSQRKWTNPPLAADVRRQYLDLATKHSYDSAKHVLPHGSYLVNLAQADDAKAEQAYASFVDDLGRCDQLGIRLYNFHPGNSGGADKKEACARIAKMLNRAHGETDKVVAVLENMAGAGNVLGARFEELRDIIDGVEDKTRVGVCIDTCHAFAAGYDLRTPEAFAKTMKEFDEVVGLKYLMAFHLNDSKAPLASNRDLHANIGTGYLGLRAFHTLMNDDTFAGMPMVLETPIDRKGPDGKSFEDKQVWADEIKLLESLIGMDPEGEEFKAAEERLWEQGKGERERVGDQVQRREAKTKAKADKGKGKGKVAKPKAKAPAAKGRAKKKVKDETDDDDDSDYE